MLLVLLTDMWSRVSLFWFLGWSSLALTTAEYVSHFSCKIQSLEMTNRAEGRRLSAKIFMIQTSSSQKIFEAFILSVENEKVEG